MRVKEFDYYISPDGKSYNLHNMYDKFVFATTGTGMPPVAYITQKGPYQHGEDVIDYRLQPRLIQMILRRNGCDRYEYWQNRLAILDMLRPNRQAVGQITPGVLRKVFPDGSKKDIGVFINQGPAFAEQDPEGAERNAVVESIRWYCPDPIFYDPTQVCLYWSLVPTYQLVFPITFPIVFSGGVINSTLNVTYTGSWMTYPDIEIIGPLNGIVINQLTTNEKMTLAYDVSAGETLTISLKFGNKTVTSSLTGNKIGSLSGDIATFHIASEPEAPLGMNSIQVIGSNASIGTTLVRLAYYTKFIGY